MKLALCTTLAILAQGKAPEKPDAKAFLASLAKALRTEGTPGKVTSFAADVRVQLTTREAKVDIDAHIDFHAPAYLKTSVLEQGKTKVRALSDDGPWMKLDGPAYWITSKEYTKDRRSLYRDLSVAGAMRRYLYPDVVLADLDALEGPVEVDKKWGRKRTIPSYRIRGIARNGRNWTLALTPGHKDPVRITAWFRRKDRFPIAVRLEPLDAKGKRVAASSIEELRFSNHVKKDALILPGKVIFSASQPGTEELRILQKVQLLDFRANPKELTPGSFAKPD